MVARMPFGRTGHESARTLFGAASLGSVSQAEADATLELLLEHGVNHIDTAASYGDSELRIAPWLPQHLDGLESRVMRIGRRAGRKGWAQKFHSTTSLLCISLLWLHQSAKAASNFATCLSSRGRRSSMGVGEYPPPPTIRIAGPRSTYQLTTEPPDSMSARTA